MSLADGTSAKLTIFEGPDGSGKSTAAKTFAQQTGARYVHCGPFPHVTSGLPRLYVEAMLPALLGYQDVVMDRCWLSELPYAQAYREGRDRLTLADRRMLTRLALRCGAVVVRCGPPWEVVKANYLARRHLEMLTNEHQLKEVYQLYRKQPSGLPVIDYNYLAVDETQRAVLFDFKVEAKRTFCHPLDVASAGAWDATTVLVGEAFGELKNDDPLYRWPFASFSQAGCSQWLADQLEEIGKPELELMWLNADQDLRVIQPNRTIYALGEVAAEALDRVGLKFIKVPHPQYHKRFHASLLYPLKDNL